MTNLKQKIVSPFVMWLIIILGALAAFKFAPTGFVFQSNSALVILLVVAAAVWLYLVIGAMLVNRYVIFSV